jgi:hypothetical protein
MLNKAWNNEFIEIDLHTMILMVSTYPSTIWHKSSQSYAPAEFHVWVRLLYCCKSRISDYQMFRKEFLTFQHKSPQPRATPTQSLGGIFLLVNITT